MSRLPADRVVLEVAIPVSRFGGDFDKTRAYTPTQAECRASLKDYLQEAGLARRNSSAFRVEKLPEFCEFDSTNPSHACGYWNFQVVGPAEMIKRILEE